MKLRPFDKLDWESWAGTEGNDPMIHESENDFGIWTAIADDNGASINLYMHDNPAGNDWMSWILTTPTQKQAEYVLQMIDPTTFEPSKIEYLGFEQIL